VFVFVIILQESKFMSKAKSVVGSIFFHRTSSHTSYRASSDMEFDPPTFATGSSSCQCQEELYTLLRDNHIKFEDN
jgi:fatty-acid desaturase